MNTTEYTTFMVPNSDELQQLSELYKASNSLNVVSSLSSNAAINTFPTQARLPFTH